METTVKEIADRIYRLSTWVPDIAPPAGFTFNQFLVDADEPLLFHCGYRSMFSVVSEAAATVVPVERIRWITFGHVEPDECGSMNQWLAAAPHAEVAHGGLGCMVSLNDMADRPPRPLEGGEVLDLGSHRVRHLDTPHVPHGWEARLLFEEVTGTLLCGDLFGQTGNVAFSEGSDLVEPAFVAEDAFRSTCLTPTTGSQLRRLAELEPRTLALMHGPSWSGDGGAALRALASGYEERIASA